MFPQNWQNCRLYLIPFLHQTTTGNFPISTLRKLYLIPFLHQTTTRIRIFFNNQMLYLIPFLHQTTTLIGRILILSALYLIPFLHQTTTSKRNTADDKSCILFHFYIKPQLTAGANSYVSVVSYSISTSNHNLWRIRRYFQAHYHLNHILIFNGML